VNKVVYNDRKFCFTEKYCINENTITIYLAPDKTCYKQYCRAVKKQSKNKYLTVFFVPRDI